MPKPVSPVIAGLEEFETYRGGPRAGQTWNDEMPVLIVDEGRSAVAPVGIMCRWELSPEDRVHVANGADIVLTLFTGGGCPAMYVEIMGKKMDAEYMAKERGVRKDVPARLRMYTPEQIEEIKKKREGGNG